MEDFSFLISNKYSTASFKGREFIHKIQEKESFEWKTTYLCNSCNFSNKILIFELIFCIPLNSIKKSFRDWEHIKEIDKST